jgi:formylglycine-generating enzyme required for sulfatase activity
MITYLMNRIMSKLIFASLLILQCSLLWSSPLGTRKINDSIYVDESEIDIGSWLSYYSWTLKYEGLSAAQKLLPDSNAIDLEIWKYINSKSPNINNTLAHSTGLPIGFFDTECKDSKQYGKRLRNIRGCCSFIGLPITGITYEQAERFCAWRTKEIEKNKMVCRLPTPFEWEEIAKNGLVGTKITDTLTNSKCPTFNYKIKCQCDKDSVFGKLNAIAYWMPDKNGLFDLFGNVSEMTSEKGVSKGGNYGLYAEQCKYDLSQHYEKPEKWLGFRCIVVVIRKK